MWVSLYAQIYKFQVSEANQPLHRYTWAAAAISLVWSWYLLDARFGINLFLAWNMDISIQFMVTDKSNIVSQVVVPFGMCQPALHLELTILTLKTVTSIHEKNGRFYAHCGLFSNQRKSSKGFLIAAC